MSFEFLWYIPNQSSGKDDLAAYGDAWGDQADRYARERDRHGCSHSIPMPGRRI